MKHADAIRILRDLANGIDPYTGQDLPHDAVYQHPQTIRALFRAVQALEQVGEIHNAPSTTSSRNQNAELPSSVAQTTISPAFQTAIPPVVPQTQPAPLQADTSKTVQNTTSSISTRCSGKYSWTDDDNTVAFYLYRFGPDSLPLSRDELGNRLGMG